MAKLFGTDGIRGIVSESDMSVELAKKMGKALVAFCQKRNLPEKIVIARDTRESGPMLEEAVVSGINMMGGDAILAGVLPTPGLAFLVKDQQAGAGLVISASHNPADYNGLKPFKNDGTKLTDEEEAEMEKYILEEANEKNPNPGKKVDLDSSKKKYVDFILSKTPAEAKGKNLKIVLDCANGATFEVAPEIFKKISLNVDVLFASPDGKNINENCGSQHTENLKNEVLEKKADIGLAFDGDGDRMIAIDEKGNQLLGDQIIFAIAKMLKAKGELKNDIVVTTVMSNLGFVAALKKLGIGHHMTAVGDRPVFFEMKKRDAILGAEECGHIICTTIHPAGDGIVGALMLVTAMNYFQKPLSALAAEITFFPKLLVNVEVKSKPEIETIPEIMDSIKEVENKLGLEGRVLVRYSGTENLCRVMVEGKDKLEVKEYADKIAGVVKNKLA